MAFWNKDEKVRIDQTIAHICSLCPQAERGTIKAFLDKRVTRFGDAAMQLASGRLSTKGQGAVGNEAERAARRALVLICELLDNGMPYKMTPAQVMGLPNGTVTANLNALNRPFRIYALQQENVRTLLQAELNELKTQPATFLQNKLVACQSFGNPPGGVHNHHFFYNFAKNMYMMLPAGMGIPPDFAGVGLIVPAANVPEIYWASVPNRGNVATGTNKGGFGGIAATDLAGAELMVTSAFTGCSFCFKSGAGGTFAAHIGPSGGETGVSIGAAPELATQLGGLHGTGNFASPAGATAGPLRVWGKGFSNVPGVPATGYDNHANSITESMFVIGTRGPGGWQFHSQQNHNGAKTVHRIL